MNKSNVEFVEYNGCWPCLCHGVLTVKINGQLVEFDDITSGGNCGFDRDGCEDIEEGPWFVDVPEEWEEYEDEINDCMNANVPWGCCGGCL